MKVSPVLISAIGAMTGLLVFGAGVIRTLSASRIVAQSGNSFLMELDPPGRRLQEIGLWLFGAGLLARSCLRRPLADLPASYQQPGR